jgi:hypothetical protein
MTDETGFMSDPAVRAAVDQLEKALDATVAARGGEVKNVAIVAHTTLDYDGSTYFGCDCAGCKRALADVFGNAIGAKATMIKLAAIDMHSPVKGVH